MCGYGMGVTAWHMMARVTCLSLLVGRVPWQQVQQQFPLPTPRGISPAPRGLHVLAFAPPDSLRQSANQERLCVNTGAILLHSTPPNKGL